MEENIEKLLKERRKTHSDPVTTHALAKRVFCELLEFSELTESSECELFLVCVKLARLVHNPGYRDNYTDIKGYITLMERVECSDPSSNNPGVTR